MKKILPLIAFSIVFVLPTFAFAQTMMHPLATSGAVISETAQDEAAGKAVVDKLQAKEIQCADISDDDFDKVGDYFMGLMMGSSHEAMNVSMEQKMGADQEKQMHVVMGKRMSGCDNEASYPASGASFLSMMGGGSTMMNGTYGYGMHSRNGFTGGIGMAVCWVLIALGVAFAVKLFKGGWQQGGNAALDILKMRFAKGEITKEEFEDKKKVIA